MDPLVILCYTILSSPIRANGGGCGVHTGFVFGGLFPRYLTDFLEEWGQEPVRKPCNPSHKGVVKHSRGKQEGEE